MAISRPTGPGSKRIGPLRDNAAKQRRQGVPQRVLTSYAKAMERWKTVSEEYSRGNRPVEQNKERIEAIGNLARYSNIPKAREILLKSLTDLSVGVRYKALTGLAGLGGNATEGEALQRLYKKGDFDAITRGIRGLAEYGWTERDRSTVQEFTSGRYPEIMGGVSSTLADMALGHAYQNEFVRDLLISLSRYADPAVKINALMGFVRFMDDPLVKTELLRAAKSGNIKVRERAADTLSTWILLGSCDRNVIDEVKRLSRDKDPNIRNKAGYGLQSSEDGKSGDIRRKFELARKIHGVNLDMLRKLAGNKHPIVTGMISKALDSLMRGDVRGTNYETTWMVTDPKKALESVSKNKAMDKSKRLKEMQRIKDQVVTELVAQELGVYALTQPKNKVTENHGPGSALLALTRSEYPGARGNAVKGLTTLIDAEEVGPVFLSLCKDKDEGVRRNTVDGLAMLRYTRTNAVEGPRLQESLRNNEAAKKALVMLSKDKSASVRILVALNWARGAAARSAEDGRLLMRLYEDPEPSVREKVAMGLAGQRDNQNATGVLLKLTKDPHPTVKTIAIRSLANHIWNGEMRGRLMELTAEKDPDVISAAVGTLGRLAMSGLKDEEIETRVRELLEHPDQRVKFEAAKALRFISQR